MRMRVQSGSEDSANTIGECDQCGRNVYRYRGMGDLDCECGAIYNSSGQRLRDDLYSRPNPSDWDDQIGDLEGYEMAFADRW